MKLFRIFSIFLLINCVSNSPKDINTDLDCNSYASSYSKKIEINIYCIRKVNDAEVVFDSNLCKVLESRAKEKLEKLNIGGVTAIRIINTENVEYGLSDYFLPSISFGLIPLQNRINVIQNFQYKLKNRVFEFEESHHFQIKQGLFYKIDVEDYIRRYDYINDKVNCEFLKQLSGNSTN